ncbi:MAG: type II toxin-antitoxin system YafQ family toxin [Mailhella sp.]
MPLLAKLVNNEPLEERHHDHLLTGDKKGYRDCHIKPDLLLIYQKPDLDTLILIRLGSHAEIF